MLNYRKKVAIVTGGATGIGYAISLELGRKGAIVVVADQNEESASKAAQEIINLKGTAIAVWLDITKPEELTKLIQKILADFGRLDLMFNCAASGIHEEIGDPEKFKQLLNVNQGGIIYGTLAAYQVMLGQGFGHIVNTSSLNDLMPEGISTFYNAVKSAVVFFSTSLRNESSKLGVKVSVVYPEKQNHSKKIGALDCAKMILKGVSNNKGSIPVAGSVI